MKSKLVDRWRHVHWKELVLRRPDSNFGTIGYLDEDEGLLEINVAPMDRHEAGEVAAILLHFAETGELKADADE